MSRLEVPLLDRKLWQTGDVMLRAELDVLVKDNRGIWKPLTIRADSGSEITSMAAARAKDLDLPYPQRPVPGLTQTTAGGLVVTEVRACLIRAQVVGMDGTEYVFPCYFLGDPDASFDPSNPPPAFPRNLLGLSGVVDKIRISFDGSATPGAPYGNMVVEKK
jgi:hypothetical protein